MSSAAPVRRRAALAPGIKDDPVPVVENLIVWIAAVFGVVSAVATLAIVVAFIAEVVARWAGHPFDPTNWVNGFLVLATFSGLAWTTIRGEHVSVQFVAERFSPRASRITDIVIWATGSAYLIWLVITSFQATVALTWPNGFYWPIDPAKMGDQVSDGVSLTSRVPWRWLFSLAMVSFTLVALLNLVRAILGRTLYDDVERGEKAPKGEAATVLDVTRDEAEVAAALDAVVSDEIVTETNGGGTSAETGEKK